jgi:ankyrin repeat domain-containing protein 50
MLRSMITQLCPRDQLPQEIDQLYRECKDGYHQPDKENLIKTLLTLLRNSHQTYLLMDALDECSERKELFDILYCLVQISSGSMKLFITSRKERDITYYLCDIIKIIMSLEGDGVNADINLHIKKCLENDKDLRKWKPQIKQEICNALVKGAHGM